MRTHMHTRVHIHQLRQSILTEYTRILFHAALRAHGTRVGCAQQENQSSQCVHARACVCVCVRGRVTVPVQQHVS